MMVFLKCEAEQMWDVIETSLHIPVKTLDGKQTLKPKTEWTDRDKKMVCYNNEAMHILFCALSKMQFNKV